MYFAGKWELKNLGQKERWFTKCGFIGVEEIWSHDMGLEMPTRMVVDTPMFEA
jgi:hypothetical protein